MKNPLDIDEVIAYLERCKTEGWHLHMFSSTPTTYFLGQRTLDIDLQLVPAPQEPES